MLIFSVDRSDRTQADNKEANYHTQLVLEQYGAKYDVGMGVYKGQSETCYILSSHEVLGAELAKKYKQESFLEKGKYGIWYLVQTSTGKVLDYYKTIQEVSEQEAVSSDAYTFYNNKYYKGQ